MSRPIDPMAIAGAIADVTVLGAGPAGLAAAYYAGHRHASVRIVEALEEVGGQLIALYPDKHMGDVAGFPEVYARELAARLTEQGLRFQPELCLAEEASTLKTVEQGGEELIELGTDAGNTYLTRSLIVTTGHGAFAPRKLPLDGIDSWEGRGLHYLVREKAEFAGKRCVIVGGGDSALDWTLGLAEVAESPIALVHRRDRFRALESSLARARALENEGRMRILTPYEVREIHGEKSIEAVTIENTATGERERVSCEALITLLGFSSHLGAIAGWGLEHHGRRQLLVDPATMRTSRPRIYAAGDVAGYEGKITLITIALAEAAIAANNAVAEIRGEKAQPEYSSE
ncbi:MAG: NAD(P)/FAD-dependent oxidoreductase [Gaiellaceae bacterium]|jgi:thioredoxin reductase (NADPH)